MCSAPINSVTSPKTTVDPESIIISIATPVAGLAANPEVVSLAPHLIPIVRSSIETVVRSLSLA